jgi:hypothetical protein
MKNENCKMQSEKWGHGLAQRVRRTQGERYGIRDGIGEGKGQEFMNSNLKVQGEKWG